MTPSEIVTSILNNNVAVGVLIGLGLYVVLHLTLHFVGRRPNFSKKDMQAAGLNRDQRRAFIARRKRRRPNNDTTPFRRNVKSRRRTGK